VHRDILISKGLDRELARVAAGSQMSTGELINTILVCNLGYLEESDEPDVKEKFDRAVEFARVRIDNGHKKSPAKHVSAAKLRKPK